MAARVDKLQESRRNWKDKAKTRGAQLKDSQKTIRRQAHSVRNKKKEISELRDKVRTLEEAQAVDVTVNKIVVVHLTLIPFSEVRISFRAVSRVLRVLGDLFGFKWKPCAQTVINWVMKLSLVRMQQPLPASAHQRFNFTNGLIYLVDESIGHSNQKILAVLGLPADHYYNQTGSPKLSDFRCIAAVVSDSWTGEKIADLLTVLIGKVGRPAGYVVDGGTNLKKGLGIIDEQGMGSPKIEDISHFVACLLRTKYSNHPDIEAFQSCCGEISKSLKQTVLACLHPPANRVKGRFMNLHRLISWCQMAQGLSPRGRAIGGSHLELFREKTKGLQKFKSFIIAFEKDAQVLLDC